MIRNSSLLVIFALTVATALSATITPCDYTGWAQDTLEHRDGVKIVGDMNRYAIHHVSEKPKATGNSATYFVLTEPRRMWGFGQNGCRFLDLKINDIPLARTVPGENAVRNEGCFVGKDLPCAMFHLNFDGAAVNLAAYMKEGSDLLWFRLMPAEKQLRPIDKIELKLNFVISAYRGKDDPPYARYAKTAVRTIEPSNTVQMITAEDKSLFLADRNYPGAPGGGYGPNKIEFGDFDAVEKAELRLPNEMSGSVTIRLKPDFKGFDFAIFQGQ